MKKDKVMTIDEKIEKAQQELDVFKKENKHIFKTLKSLKKNLDKLYEEKQNNKPAFPEHDFSYGFLYRFMENQDSFLITEELIKKYKEEYDEDISMLLGWSISVYDEGHSAVNDGDYFEANMDFTSPEGYEYSLSEETCIAIGIDFEDKEIV